MAIVSTFPILTNMTEFENFKDFALVIPSAMAFLAFGAVCFTIGSQWIPQVSREEYEAEKAKSKAHIAMVEGKLAQDNKSDTEEGRIQDMPGQETATKARKALQSQLKTASAKNNLLSAQNEHIRAEWQKTKVELSVAKEELRGARTYLSMEDEYSGAEVVKHVEGLNAAIMQAAVNLAERLDLETMVPEESTLDESHEEVVQRAEDIIGAHLMKLLRASRDQALLELAFQAAMVVYTQSIASSWCFRSFKDEELLQESYMSMREDKLQGIFGRWRQLTKTHLRASKAVLEQRLLPSLAEELVNIVVAAGHREDPSSIRETIISSFPGALSEIIDSAKELNSMIGEGVTSSDISVVFFKPSTPYDPVQMVEADGSTTGHVGEQIVFTTELGLVGIKKMVNRTDTISVMLKAKVIVPSMLVGIGDA